MNSRQTAAAGALILAAAGSLSGHVLADEQRPQETTNQKTYLAGVSALLKKQWPGNRAVNIVCHGHSVPAGYFKTPVVDDLGDPLNQQAELVRALAAEYRVGLVDSLAEFKSYIKAGGKLTDLMSQVNHPNRKGHDLVTKRLLEWFPD